MPTVDLIVKNGKIVQKDRLLEADIVIEYGKISKLVKDSSTIKSDSTIDATGKIVIPGCIDIHVHSREPHGAKTTANQEDFLSLTKAAAAGGYTSIFDMPVVGYPPVTTVDAFNYKKRVVENKSLVDYAFYGGAGYGNIQEIKPLAAAGVIAFKIFTREIDHENDDWKGIIIGESGSKTLDRIMREVAETNKILSIHCEYDRLIRSLSNRLIIEGNTKPSAYYKSSPNASEFLEVDRCIKLAGNAGVRINIAHLSTSESAVLVEKAKREGLPVSAETCPHYLLLTNNDLVERLGPYGKAYPPLRSERDRCALWKFLIDGVIDFLATDHAPHPKEAKEPGWNNIFDAANGVPGLETALPLMMTQVNLGTIDIFKCVNIMSRNQAKVFGIDKAKGDLNAGMDADFVIIDMKREYSLSSENMYTRSSAEVFTGWKVKGMPILTAVRGVTVFDEGNIIGKEGFGKYIKKDK